MSALRTSRPLLVHPVSVLRDLHSVSSASVLRDLHSMSSASVLRDLHSMSPASVIRDLHPLSPASVLRDLHPLRLDSVQRDFRQVLLVRPPSVFRCSHRLHHTQSKLMTVPPMPEDFGYGMASKPWVVLPDASRLVPKACLQQLSPARASGCRAARKQSAPGIAMEGTLLNSPPPTTKPGGASAIHFRQRHHRQIDARWDGLILRKDLSE